MCLCVQMFECSFNLLPPISSSIGSPIEFEAHKKQQQQRKICSKMSNIDIEIQLNFNRLNPSIVYELLPFSTCAVHTTFLILYE